jgi:microcystin-dependent protein
MCSNCYNGCTDVTSDQCIRYTGIDVPVLGIKNGDTLSYVEQAIITFTTSLIDGTGMKPVIPSEIICAKVTQYLPTCQDLTALDLFKTLIQVVCDLQNQITTIDGTLTTLNGTYDIGCLTGVTGASGTHAILQAAITKLCGTATDLSAFETDVTNNYVKLADLNSLIQAYLNTLTTSTKYYTKMVPYTVVEYWGTLGNFDATGAGLGDWEKIYLCNGLNGTPDKRGRVTVGAISGVPGGTLASAVNPAADPSFNPNYALGDIAYGTNKITLDSTQIPVHSHVATVTDPKHSHHMATNDGGLGTGLTATGTMAKTHLWGDTSSYNLDQGNPVTPTLAPTESVATGITVSNSNTGGGLAHDNKQPSIAAYYIMYIP